MHRILIVEDEERIASFLTRALATDDLEVRVAPDGRSALHAIQRSSFDLILLDLVLPGVDGVSVLRELALLRPGQQVLVMSAVPDVRVKVECLDLGAADYVTKPFALPELLARIRARLRAEAAPVAHLRHGDLTIDLVRRHATRAGCFSTLTSREMLVLRLLVDRAGRACSRTELLEAAWGPDAAIEANAVDVYVARLRAKLGDDLIRTVRGVGYAVEEATRAAA